MSDPDPDVLDNAAYDVADEYRSGMGGTWPGAGDWPDTWAALRAELERRCPGFTREQYDQALNDGFTASR